MIDPWIPVRMNTIGVSEVEENDLSSSCVLRSLNLFYEHRKINPAFLKGYCDATWDSIYCWPFTPPGVTLTRACVDVMQDSTDFTPSQLARVTGNAIRVCGDNGTWLWGNWTNYNECLESLGDDVILPESEYDGGVVEAVRWILFLGSIASFMTIAVSLFIFYYFKRLRCDRVTLHIHLMLSLALRFLLFTIITEPFIFNRKEHYRKVDFICKSIMSMLMYTSVTSVNWMFIQGHYLHGRLTTNIFDKGTPFRVYYFIGWGIPIILILIWAAVMDTFHQVHCWQNFSKLSYIWILVGPMICALFVNLLFLVNIMRILLTKIQRATTSTDSAQFRRAVKATAILFPLLGINNLLFLYNPGGSYENAYMLSNTIVQSTQGVFVSFLYCFISYDVREAIRRKYRRFTVRRSANSIHRSRRRTVNRTSVIFHTPRTAIVRTERAENGIREILNVLPDMGTDEETGMDAKEPRGSSENGFANEMPCTSS